MYVGWVLVNMEFWLAWVFIDLKIQPSCTYSHCVFSPNLFHGQITQISIDQMSFPENKKCSPWKVFGINHPQTLPLLSRRGPRGPDAWLSQHYIGPKEPKMTFCHFSNFYRKKFLGMTKYFFCTYWMNTASRLGL